MNHLVTLALLWLPEPSLAPRPAPPPYTVESEPDVYDHLPPLAWCETALAACDADLAWLDARIELLGGWSRARLVNVRRDLLRARSCWRCAYRLQGGTTFDGWEWDANDWTQAETSLSEDELAERLFALIGADAFRAGALPLPLGLGK